ncbi:helix-turn-helix domain-containing protein [Aneurinibacillus tyrosinisolvens]|uniref:helix-turn-helix domain-containing protein n=1 Tax=Aneurinibacillus tyrosinisolvens TaxID=1443435 RepID=UPI000B11B7E7|nr:helix-turn-helix domain-containing protein [Aneurinibacillus tyrosinisolvens]
MKESKADLILHPVRMRVIQALAGGCQLTTQQLIELLPDIPQATLYRHINKLLKADVISVAEQRQVRGTIEKVYTLPEQNGNLSREDLVNATREDHMRYFTTFLSTLQGDFSRYLQQENYDLLADGVGYRHVPLYMSDEEFHDFIQTVRTSFLKYAENKPAPGRRRRTITTIIIPEPDHKYEQ